MLRMTLVLTPLSAWNQMTSAVMEVSRQDIVITKEMETRHLEGQDEMEEGRLFEL